MQLLLSVITLFLISTNISESHSRIKINIPSGINLTEKELMRCIPSLLPDKKNFNESIEITVYYYSQGIERLSYTDGMKLTRTTQKGKIKALLKFKRNNKLKKAQFITALGRNREEILKNFSIRITDILMKNH